MALILGVALCANAFAEPSVTLDRQSYSYGDAIKVSGKVQYVQGEFVIIQIRSASDMPDIRQFVPPASGSFSAMFEAEGPKWQIPGTYTVMVSYNSQTAEKAFQFTIPEGAKPSQPEKVSIPKETPEKPKVTVRGFPDPSRSPQHYIDRYENEPEFRRWFEATFPGFSIYEIVGYEPTHVSSFPDPAHSPQYYIDRYENEEAFREWFDAQFPQKTIYDVVGAPEEIRKIVPTWVKQYARWWYEGSIGDAQFADRISELIRQNVIIVDESLPISNNQNKAIPGWFKNNALWYYQGHITEDDFMSGIQYLIEQEVIVV